jgi:AraC-like DNA-binding protein
VIICVNGSFEVPGRSSLSVDAPGLLWLPIGPRASAAAGDIAPAQRAPRLTARSDSRGWLLVIGRRLLDQLVVSAFGEPGFCRFLEGIAAAGNAPCSAFGDDLVGLLRDLREELDARPPAYRVRARSLLTDVLLSTYRATLTASITAEPNGFRVATVIDFIELNYEQALQLESLARLVQTSATHLSRVFRREVGMPLFEYINRTRIRKACVLLRRTDLSITRIAVDVGYNNVSFFNRYFRRIMRSSPREYRRSVTE